MVEYVILSDVFAILALLLSFISIFIAMRLECPLNLIGVIIVGILFFSCGIICDVYHAKAFIKGGQEIVRK